MNTMTALIPFIIMGIGLKIAGPHLQNKNETFISSGICFGIGGGLLVCKYISGIPVMYGVSVGFLIGVLAGSNIKKPRE